MAQPLWRCPLQRQRQDRPEPQAPLDTAGTQEITRHTLVHEQLISFYRGFKHDAHPMAIMVGVVGALAAFYPAAADIRSALACPCKSLISRLMPRQGPALQQLSSSMA